jgi:amidase
MRDSGLIALIAPTTSRAWTNDPKDDDDMQGSACQLAAVAGYPHLTVPMGHVTGLPVGISFLGPAWSEARLLSLGFAYEQAARARREPGFPPDVAARPEIARVLQSDKRSSRLAWPWRK